MVRGLWLPINAAAPLLSPSPPSAYGSIYLELTARVALVPSGEAICCVLGGCAIVSKTGFIRAGRRYGPILGMDLLCLERRGAPFFSRSMYITREVGCNHRTYPLQGIPHTQALNFRDICGGGAAVAARLRQVGTAQLSHT